MHEQKTSMTSIAIGWIQKRYEDMAKDAHSTAIQKDYDVHNVWPVMSACGLYDLDWGQNNKKKGGRVSMTRKLTTLRERREKYWKRQILTWQNSLTSFISRTHWSRQTFISYRKIKMKIILC